MCARHVREAVDRHAAAALNHEELAAHWKATSDPERAAIERRNAELERMAAELERDRAALTERRQAELESSGEGEVEAPGTSGAEVLRAVEILRGTTYDFRIEATTDVAALFGTDVLIAALERLDNEIEPRPRRAKVARRS
jgi:hypothetical protein